MLYWSPRTLLKGRSWSSSCTHTAAQSADWALLFLDESIHWSSISVIWCYRGYWTHPMNVWHVCSRVRVSWVEPQSERDRERCYIINSTSVYTGVSTCHTLKRPQHLTHTLSLSLPPSCLLAHSHSHTHKWMNELFMSVWTTNSSKSLTYI